jgi:hypothetical protein
MITDTAPEVEALVLALRRRQSPGQRITNALEMGELVRSLEMGLLRARHPGASEARLLFLLAEKRHGRALAECAFGAGTA